MSKELITKLVNDKKPDLITLSGDNAWGYISYLEVIEFIDSLGIPWAPVFGNHDNESLKGVDWQCRQLEAAEYCLFKQGDLTGNGNYSVGIVQGGKTTDIVSAIHTIVPILRNRHIHVTHEGGHGQSFVFFIDCTKNHGIRPLTGLAGTAVLTEPLLLRPGAASVTEVSVRAPFLCFECLCCVVS